MALQSTKVTVSLSDVLTWLPRFGQPYNLAELRKLLDVHGYSYTTEELEGALVKSIIEGPITLLTPEQGQGVDGNPPEFLIRRGKNIF